MSRTFAHRPARLAEEASTPRAIKRATRRQGTRSAVLAAALAEYEDGQCHPARREALVWGL